MRWWLSLAFALVAALTAVAVVLVSSQRTGQVFRDRSEDLAIGNAVGATEDVRLAIASQTLASEVPKIADRRGMSLFVFAASGTLLTPSQSRGIDLAGAPEEHDAVAAALEGRRFVHATENGGVTVVALPARGTEAAAVLAYVPRPVYTTSIGIFRRQVIIGALIAFPIGAGAGALVAWLLAARLRRIAASAAAIEAGSFETALRPRFRDELGELASTVDRMRQRLKHSFGELQAERDRLGLLLERLQDGVVAVDENCRVQFANPAACAAFQVDSLPTGTPLPDPWMEPHLPAMVRSLFSPGARTYETRTSLTDDSVYIVVGIPPGATSTSAVLVISDVSERERGERAEREFVANAAHELRTPVAAIVSAIDALDAGAKHDPDARDRFLAHVRRGATRLGRLSRALLLLARAQTRQESVQLVPLALRPLLEEVAADLESSHAQHVVIDCPPELEVLSDRDLLEQVLMNIVANAAKYTSDDLVRVTAEASADDGVVSIEVADTGRGIPAEDRHRVFERFYRAGSRTDDGFGLGLAIAHEASHALGGTVQIASELGQGTRVTLRLPAQDPVAAAARASPVRVRT